MNILGSPKEMKHTLITNLGIGAVNEYKFYRNGIVKEQKSNPGSNILVKAVDSKIKKVVHSSLEAGNESNGVTFKPQKYDSLGRVTLISSESISSNNVSFSVGGTSVWIIRYSDIVRTADSYFKIHGEIGPLNRFRTEYSSNEMIVAACWGGQIGEACDRNKPITEYGPHGVTRNLTGKFETIYSYSNGLLISEIRNERHSGINDRIIEYSSYVLDDCGNWISREVKSSLDKSNPHFERREISYYKKCSE